MALRELVYRDVCLEIWVLVYIAFEAEVSNFCYYDVGEIVAVGGDFDLNFYVIHIAFGFGHGSGCFRARCVFFLWFGHGFGRFRARFI